MITAAATPRAAHSPTIAGTVAAGVTMTARSTGVGNVGDRTVGRQAEHAVVLRVDRIDRPAERGRHQVVEQRSSDTAGRLGRANDRHRTRAEERIQRMGPRLAEKIVRQGRRPRCWHRESRVQATSRIGPVAVRSCQIRSPHFLRGWVGPRKNCAQPQPRPCGHAAWGDGRDLALSRGMTITRPLLGMICAGAIALSCATGPRSRPESAQRVPDSAPDKRWGLVAACQRKQSAEPKNDHPPVRATAPGPVDLDRHTPVKESSP